MVRSMTGYGRAQSVIDGLDITVEVKSVNHRYFEFSARTPRGYAFVEDKLKNYIQSRISRGKVDAFLTVVSVDDPACEVVVNEALAESYIKALKTLSEKFDIRDDVSVATVSRYQDIFTVRKVVPDEDKICADILSVAAQAVDKFIAMRETEGAKMKEDVENRAAFILSLVSKVEERSPKTVEEYMTKLKEHIAEIAGGIKFDEQRVLTEVAIYADKVAVAEETVRLRSHFAQLDEMLASDIPIGRKLDFLLQEMNRETNTIGSKAQDAELAHIVVDIKAELEKIREQIQNIE